MSSVNGKPINFQRFSEMPGHTNSGKINKSYLLNFPLDSLSVQRLEKIFKSDNTWGGANPVYMTRNGGWLDWLKGILTLLLMFGFLFALYTLRIKVFITEPSKEKSKQTKITFADVKGNIEAKEELMELVSYLKDPLKFQDVTVPKGILLVGPPGTGKTLMARALAGEAGVPFVSVSGSEFEEVFVGLGARRVRDLFEKAKTEAPCIIFIDEIDAVGRRRSPMSSDEMSLNQLLVELDGFKKAGGVVVIGATNMVETLDKALVRPGRFDRHIYLSFPERKERKELFDHYLARHPVAQTVDTGLISKATAGMSGADIENIVNWAAIDAIKMDSPITIQHLEKAILNVAMGKEKKSMVLSEKVKKIVAYHESGHALVALKTKGAPEIRKATLVPRGDALGMVNYIPDDEYSVSKSQLYSQMCMAMGGRVAEEIVFGKLNVTNGASSDFQGATSIAYSMVTELGMSPEIGHVYAITRSDPYVRKKLDLADKQKIDEEVHRILEEAYSEAKKILSDNEKELHLLAKALLKYETLDKKQILEVISGKFA
eukprot:TRINITY_DN13480_c0_g2_i2.p1 TRINITY_DN13480_c0_g2~~TRINITY_DN13480_c0_g2_i2.p1  ORF type:complete len:544 (-),score=109.12 TRINITY_DN13480_c0_g2_i2:23-1654(-)